ncbi:uncharacterized protein LOC115317441 [Ixodes scapularis]|uniref:uncharacterized protein LOC115317441 n=1 Tax=Ixodes scapularis TaxID=6945 RepID=UPI001C38450B|nr:uncharacterized protein LOC115317441 [Ixodes scapularis]
MLAATVFTVIIAAFGPITCFEESFYWRCPDEEFQGPGYALGCSYLCISGHKPDKKTYYGYYKDATVCVDLTGGDPELFNHVGTCKNGKCVQYAGANIEEVWSTLPETQRQFHDCNIKSSPYPVGKCMHICKKNTPYGKSGYFFGAYQDYSACIVNGKTGECKSGLCVPIRGRYPIEN